MLGLALACLGLTGCAEIQEVKINIRNRYLAKEAWQSLQETAGCMNHESDFGRGFRAGYYDVALGGNGCPPPLPPQRYWSVRYMSITGREKTEAWFAGFRYGAMVAQQDGIGTFLELPTSIPEESTRRSLPMPPDLDKDESEVPAEAGPVPTEGAATEEEGSAIPQESAPPLDSPLLPEKSDVPTLPIQPEGLAPPVPSVPVKPSNPNK
jgi:hypothetical protein